MSDATYIGNLARSIKTSPEFDGISKVILQVSDELHYESGTGTGRSITVRSPWGSQKIADDILARLQGFQYQPYTAAGAPIDPAAELGDGVTVSGIYSGIFEETAVFGKNYFADLSAPFEEEIDHEYPYVSKQERQIQRQYAEIRSTFKVQAEQIDARVEKIGGDAESFGWTLKEDSWTLSSESKDVLKADKNGVEITGKITATSGKIGGFDIMSDYLSYNKQTWEGTNQIGAYLGVNGIQLGTKFQVDMQGNLYAASGTFAGTIYAGNIVFGKDEYTGVNYGTLNGSAITAESIGSGKIKANSLGTGQLSKGVNTSLDYADKAGNFFKGTYTAEKLLCEELSASKKLSGNTLFVGGTKVHKKSISFKDGNGETQYIYYFGWEP